MKDYYMVDGKKETLERITGTFFARVDDPGDLEDIALRLQAKGTVRNVIPFEDEGYLVISGAESAASLREEVTFDEVTYITPAYKNPGSLSYPEIFVSNTILLEFSKPFTDDEVEDFMQTYDLELGRKSKHFYEFNVKNADDNKVFTLANFIDGTTDVDYCSPNFVKIGGM